MSEFGYFCPHFNAPPVTETFIGVQFPALQNFLAAHYGILCKSVFEPDWLPDRDLPPLPIEQERMGQMRLATGETEYQSPIRIQLSHVSEQQKIDFQTSRLRLYWSQSGGVRTGYTDIKPRFEQILNKLRAFSEKAGFGQVVPNFWEIQYTNLIPPGELWTTPEDWHRVFPTLFQSNGPTVAGLKWSTFDGRWIYEISPSLGRVEVKVQKVVVNPTETIALYCGISARGDVGEPASWPDCLDSGHRAAVQAFYGLASPAAKQAWGEK
jgi:hypothetical protein